MSRKDEKARLEAYRASIARDHNKRLRELEAALKEKDERIAQLESDNKDLFHKTDEDAKTILGQGVLIQALRSKLDLTDVQLGTLKDSLDIAHELQITSMAAKAALDALWPRRAGRTFDTDDVNLYCRMLESLQTHAATGAMLITARSFPRTHIVTERFPTKEDAYRAMKEAMRNRILMDEPAEETDKMISMMEDGIDFSNMEMREDSAHIYQDQAETWHFWKIVEL